MFLKACPTPKGWFRFCDGSLRPTPCNSWRCPYCSLVKLARLHKRLAWVHWTLKIELTLVGDGSPTIENLVRQAHALKSFFQWLRREFGTFRYFWSREIGKDGRLHAHLLLDLPFIEVGCWPNCQGEGHAVGGKNLKPRCQKLLRQGCGFGATFTNAYGVHVYGARKHAMDCGLGGMMAIKPLDYRRDGHPGVDYVIKQARYASKGQGWADLPWGSRRYQTCHVPQLPPSPGAVCRLGAEHLGRCAIWTNDPGPSLVEVFGDSGAMDLWLAERGSLSLNSQCTTSSLPEQLELGFPVLEVRGRSPYGPNAILAFPGRSRDAPGTLFQRFDTKGGRDDGKVSSERPGGPSTSMFGC